MTASIKSSENSMTDERDQADAARPASPTKKKSRGAKRAAEARRESADREAERETKRDAEKKARAAEAQRRIEEAESERRLAKLIAITLPLATVGGALAVGVSSGIATGLLVLAGGVVLGAVAAAWASVRTLTGDAPLPHSLEAAEIRLGASDSRVARRTMLLRALKDLESERAIGKLSEDDFESVAPRYRDELKTLLKEIDAELSPHRPKAEALAAAHMRKVGLAERATATPEGETLGEVAAKAGILAREDDDREDDEQSDERATDDAAAKPTTEERPVEDATKPSDRVACPACEESNEPDAKFCKACGGSLRREAERSSDAS